ncbi:3',5'-cyclic AMP phosphodiesterase CpdA [Mycobacterium frederiksbergense]|uniref:3',5'-cyclic AMP phosphodiesterase CpdA n=1 Tax=Mycolicibacterium frederiksbergense TaxID=117567 RepID=A0ABT6L073_9MYCO|nr:metallophosphoesterase family protein [Mycolicibacterium frederiksbergense]MDH6196346.1 3',5'-cyclic AMP phosphodiesterase CpdA [Mycolicibacterium frederiksbergense]
MTDNPGISRRTLLLVGGSTAILGAGAGLAVDELVRPAATGPVLWQREDRSGAPRISGLHLQYGADAASEVVVSWNTDAAVGHPRVLYGTPGGGLGDTADADTYTYRDAQSDTEIRVHHARLTGLLPDTDYVYAAVHDGANPELGTVRTAPRGRAPLRFTSFGDQSTPTLDAMVANAFGSDSVGSPAAGDITSAVERMRPLFHLVNGDLCYANLSADRIRTWSDWFENNSRSARYRPWMPAAGNHENELGNGPIGYSAYQAYFALPDSGADPELRGMWYAFTAGAVRVISLNNDDVCYQDGGNFYVHGYSGGAQKRWLRRELEHSNANEDIDWIVVCMHQTAVSTADRTNGADLGIRENWLPLFDRYGVDLVVCGHEHHYERTHPIRGTLPTDTLTPAVVDQGTVHLVIGGGGTSIPSNRMFFPEPRCRVLTDVGGFDPALKKRAPHYVQEAAAWSAFRDRDNAYGFVMFDVDPGSPGGQTSIDATYFAVGGPFGETRPVDHFRLSKPRRG